MSSPLTIIYEFDRFRLDRGNQRLTRDGLLVSTPGLTFPLLLTLIENREVVISTEKLVNSFFPRSTFGDEELAAEVLQLKRLLDDTSKQAPMIRSIRGQGYQFESEVTEYLGDAANDSKFGTKHTEKHEWVHPTAAKAAKKSGVPAIGIAVAAIALLGVGFAIWHFAGTSHANGDAASSNSSSSADDAFSSSAASGSEASTSSDGNTHVAVLPFQSLTGAAGDDKFNQSLTDAIVRTLTKEAKVAVVSEDSVRKYVESGASDPVTAGRELGAQMIVHGMAQRLAGRVMVKVQLISTRDGNQIWSEGFEGDQKDVGTLSAKISARIGHGAAGDQP